MARKRNRQYDEIYNVRRRIDRAVKRAEREGRSKADIRALQASSNYLRGSVTREKLETARSINRTLGTSRATAVQRRTAIYKQQMKIAGEAGSVYTKEEVQLFFASTRRIWVGQHDETGAYVQGTEDPAKRTERIMDYFYGSSGEAKEFQRWQRRTYGTERKDLNYLVEWITEVDERNRKALEQAVPDSSGGTPSAFTHITTYG